MAAFSLTKSGKTYDFELNGDVTRNGARVGQWTTSNDDMNQLVVAEDGGAANVTFPVQWKFNDKNQLEVHNNNGLLYNWHSVTGTVPLYRLNEVALVVRPDRSASHAFTLNGEWTLDEKYDLHVKFGTVSSVIDGAVEDDRSRFAYKFSTKAGDIELYQLTFPGSWSGRNDDGRMMMTFNYLRRGENRSFALPESALIDPKTNQLVVAYEKNGRRRRLQIVGDLKINSKFQLTYKIDRQQDVVNATTIQIQVTFNAEQIKNRGELSFTLMKRDGVTPGIALIIGGQYQHDANGTKLRLAFQYECIKQGGVVIRNALTFAGEFVLRDDLTLAWKFSTDIATRTTTVNLDIQHFKLKDFEGNLSLAVKTAGGQVREISVLFGFRF